MDKAALVNPTARRLPLTAGNGSPPSDEFATGDKDPYSTGPWADQRLLDSLMCQRLDRAAAALTAAIGARTTLEWGSHLGGPLHAAQTEHPGLVVVASGQAGALEHVLHHHGTHSLLRHAGVPVLVVPEGR